MPRQGRQGLTPEELLADYPPQIRQIANQLRRLVKGQFPEVVERAYPGWRGIGYRHPDAGYFVGIFLHPDKARLGLEYGARLPDPGGVLKPGPSGGGQVRYLEMAAPQDIDPEQIAGLLTAAVELQRSRRGK